LFSLIFSLATYVGDAGRRGEDTLVRSQLEPNVGIDGCAEPMGGLCTNGGSWRDIKMVHRQLGCLAERKQH
jgi:hypothetical protein